MKKHGKKMIAPIVIIVIMVLYFIFWGGACLLHDEIPLAVRILGVVLPVSFIGVGIFVLVERIKEIRSGEEDDLSQY